MNLSDHQLVDIREPPPLTAEFRELITKDL